MNTSTCYIFAAGDFIGNFKKSKKDFIIAADSGYAHLKKLGIIPDILLGDFDTIETMPDINNVIKFPTEKNYTDSCLAVEEAIRRGYINVTIIGGIGGKRLEHTIANIQLLVNYAKRGINIRLTDGVNQAIALFNSSIEFSENNTGFISIFSHSDKSVGVNISGLKYTLKDAVLTNDTPLGISNEFIGKKASVSVEDGLLIIIYKPVVNE